MSSLLAILLVIKSDAGERFVFRYPAYPRRREKVKPHSYTSPREQHHSPGGGDWHHPNPMGNVYGVYGYSAPESFDDPSLRQSMQRRKEGGGTGAPGGGLETSTVVGNGLGPHSSSNESIPQDRWNYDPLLGFNVNFLAGMLSPRTSMCDKKFQLTIDDLTFVGHPTSLTGEDFERRKSLVVLPQSEENRYSDDDSEYTHEISDSPDIGSRSPLRQQADRHGERDEHLHPNDSSDFSKRRSPKSSASPKSSHMTQFHLVFVLSPSDLELNHEVEAIYKHVVIKFTAALRYEQLRCEYVRKETEKIMHLTDEMNKRREEFNKKKEEANKNGPSPESPDDIMDQILSVSSLARDIKHVYHSITNDTVAHIILNDFVDLSLQIPTFGSGSYPLYASQETDYYSMIPDLMRASGRHEYEAYPALCPYHALLLLQDPEEVLKDMPLDSSPTLVQLVQVLTPTLSMQDLSQLLDCSLAQVYRFAAHLIYWRKAKLIHKLAVQNIYIVSPQANLNDLSTLTKDFKKHVPTLDLPSLLASLSTPSPFLYIIPSKEQRNQYFEAITYLLRKDLIIQLHQFLVLMVPSHVKNLKPLESMDEEAEQEQGEKKEEGEDREGGHTEAEQLSEAMAVISGPGQATEAEREWVQRLAAEKGRSKEVIELFER
ncbi:nitrogen permease regulator of amino acid transport activity 3-domain-containing protein [Endogone sp. FLAS-F59071]|nr:nitrogen permease regulator of amino acid transport activity 3-domain-containing protein [Endogone sp. FLAS-F59071]|eukprot:RUS21510.1 nitrogen permease regulator of amino acid transport activity 3-domain-containing protein [Endogone sp. FLAS-F59071]